MKPTAVLIAVCGLFAPLADAGILQKPNGQLDRKSVV